jgi:hypothetical protein
MADEKTPLVAEHSSQQTVLLDKNDNDDVGSVRMMGDESPPPIRGDVGRQGFFKRKIWPRMTYYIPILGWLPEYNM